ncbi:MAG TPA: BrnA antitoxin family protein, partial [Longimicrobiales bacterium]|nr:BrnA antitoxin family protein [Longimicrobiales bacterium]
PGGRVLLARRAHQNYVGAQSHTTGTATVRGSVMKKEYDFTGGRRGEVVPMPPGKTRITIRLDTDVLDWFRQQVDEAGGGNYQSLINAALREYIESHREPLEPMLRRVIRDELQRRTCSRTPLS